MAAKEAAGSPPTERVLATYKQLSAAARSLNAASDELGEAISTLDVALQKLNLGISAWTKLAEGDDGESWWRRDLGYARIRDRWTIALRTMSGYHPAPEHDSEEIWAFSEGPRWLRIEAVGKIPDLLESLLKQTEDTTKKIKNRMSLARDLVAAISHYQDDRKPWRERLLAAAHEAGLAFTADAIEQSDVKFADNELVISTPEEYSLALPKDGKDIQRLLARLDSPSLTFKIVYFKRDDAAQGKK